MAGMPRLSAFDEYLVHQLPEPIGVVEQHHPHWRESLFFVAHRPDSPGDMVIMTFATFPARQVVDSLQMGRVGGVRVLGRHERPYDGDPCTTDTGAARIEIVKPFEEVRLWADPDMGELGIDLTFRARTPHYGLRRGSMRAGDEPIWDQRHMLQSGWYEGTYTHGGTTYEIDRWWGQRDHSWGIRDHGRCPMWTWWQLQLEDGMLGNWHWEFANGAMVYSDGCWSPTDGTDPVPMVRFEHDVQWVDAAGNPVAYGQHGEAVEGIRGTGVFHLEGGRRVQVEVEGSFDRPYEPFHRGGLNQVTFRTDDGRSGTGIIEITGAHHHHFFPDTTGFGTLPV